MKKLTTKRLLTTMLMAVMSVIMFCGSLSVGYGSGIENLATAATKVNNGQIMDKLDVQAVKPTQIDTNGIIEDLRKDMAKQLNKDLVKEVADYRLSGPVNVIITLSEDSAVSLYNERGSKGEIEDFLASNTVKNFNQQKIKEQNALAKKLQNAGLVSAIKYNYTTILDGFYVATTYENIEAICRYNDVNRVIVSDTYMPAVATENPVNVYDTGIFNSGDVEYTGEGTLVSVLDTGCDYTHTAFNTHQVVDPLYDRDDIARILPDTVAYSYDTTVEPREVYYGNKTKDKIAFGYDYADKDPDIMPFDNEHGTHVAGIIAGKDSAITGVAIDAQLVIMKVFSDWKVGAEDGDIIAALEDSVKLGVDAINMSLGVSCGFNREVDEEYKNEVYDQIEQAGISLVVAASNDHSSAYGSEHGNTNKTYNPDSGTVGSPSTYHSALSVASINGNKDKYMLANGEKEIYFLEAFNQSAKEYNFFEMLGVKAGEDTVLEYVAIPGYGYAINYAGRDMTGKIALVKRGDINFEDKVKYAYEAGAVAIIIYNNVYGDIVMTVGNDIKIPVVSIGKDDGDYLASLGNGVLSFNLDNQAGPFMSDFSSWGPTPSLELKPEITAHGGNIYSAIPGGGYDKLSGTSMAAPNMCGIIILIRQYVKEKFPEYTTEQVRDLVNQLCMSTATIALDKFGNPYSPRKQGAGIADLKNATSTEAFLYVDGTDKTKLELGDDPKRKGVYEMSFKLKNMSNHALSYELGNFAMTESVSADKEFVAERAYMLNHSAEYSVEGGTLNKGVVTVEGNSEAVISVKIKLSSEDKKYINSHFANGMYVEGYITLDSKNGVDLNIPFLAFYGDWGQAPIFDKDFYLVETEAHNGAIDEDDKIKADYYATTPLGKYYYDYIIPLGSYLYTMDEEKYDPIPGVREHAALSYEKDCISGIYGVFAGILRGAKEMSIQIKDTATGEIVWEDIQYNCYKSHFNGAPRAYYAEFELDMADFETGEVFGSNNSHYEVTMSAKLDWESEDRNPIDTYSFSFYVDYQAPIIKDAVFRKEEAKDEDDEDEYYVDLTVYDNHYAMSLRPVSVYMVDIYGETKRTYSSMTEYPIPIYQTERGTETVVSVEITNYIDLAKNTENPEGIVFHVDDYALNSNLFYVPLPETDNTDLVFNSESLELDINDTFDLTTYMSDNEGIVNGEYLKNLSWKTSNEQVVRVYNGKIEAIAQGTATITCESVVTGLSTAITINVTDVVNDNPESKDNANLKKLEFTSFDTLFAFNSDIDHSEIGITGSINYFDGNNLISCYPSEKVQLHYKMEPWNIAERCEFNWITTNPRVATVDSEGVVQAVAEGTARIRLEVKINNKVSLIKAYCTVEVKSEFVIENRELVAYKGNGGHVVIPDDEGILYIGSFAFSHYNLDNEMELEEDEDFDLKKSPLGNNTVTSVVIPDGVEEVRKYAFYNCSALESVTLGKDCEKIFEYAFWNDYNLKNVNFDNVRVISKYAFNKCINLDCQDIGGVNFDKLNVLGDYAFAGCKKLSEVNLADLRRSGEGSFMDCDLLTKVTFSPEINTVLAPKMFENTSISAIDIYSVEIPDYIFKGCTKLVTVNLKQPLTYVGVEAFSGCVRLKNVNFEKGCEVISNGAFFNTTALTNLQLPEGDIVFGDSVFQNSALTTLAFGKTTRIENIGLNIFAGAKNLKSFAKSVIESDYYVVDKGVLYNKEMTEIVMVAPNATLGDYVLPDTITHVGDGAFAGNASLTSFTAGANLEYIGKGAFVGCGLLTSVTLKPSVKEIGEYAFYTNENLTTVNLENVQTVGDFAFAGTGIKTANLTTNGVVIGEGAFAFTSLMKNLALGENAMVGEVAFRASAVNTITMPANGGVTLDTAAFYQCIQLTTVDLTKVTGKLGDFAFYQCVQLAQADLQNVTEIGEASFAECIALAQVNIPNVTVVGEGAFAMLTQQNSGAIFTSIDMPKVEKIGMSAFMGCINLESVDLSNVVEIGEQAFAFCVALESVTLGDNVTALEGATFYGCTALTTINLDNVKTFGSLVVYGAPLKELKLDSAETLAEQAFVEGQSLGNFIESVYAPNLKVVGEQAFVGLANVTELVLPSLEEIGIAAFAGTGITEFLVTDNLKTLDYGPLMGAENLVSVYAMVNGEKVTTCELANVVIDNGVLYFKEANGGYTLTAYPMAKTETEYTVIDNTVRIEFAAAMSNEYIQKVIMPASLTNIGNNAFVDCVNLDTVVFNSYYAPVLEGTYMNVNINKDNVGDYGLYNELYKYDFYYITLGVNISTIYYSNFIDVITSNATMDLKYIYPENSSGYTTGLYPIYFNDTTQNGERVTSGKTAGAYALAFIEAVKALPETCDRFDEELIIAAKTAYNALMAHADEQAYVSAEMISFFKAREVEYNVDSVTFAISKLYDVHHSQYSYETIRAAKQAYDNLTDEEKALITNVEVLNGKIDELDKVLKGKLDFSKEYKEYPQPKPTTSSSKGGCGNVNAWATISAILSVIAVAFTIKKKGGNL